MLELVHDMYTILTRVYTLYYEIIRIRSEMILNEGEKRRERN